ncbi:MAG: hypothetical protein GW827_00350 [Flavobacteriales bacterium]|nr:hypothetical protein [Flavobacteriales bacterium]
MKKKETFWLLGTVFLTLLLMLGIFGIDGFKSESDTAINVYDTYYVNSTINLIILLTLLILFGVYLIRMLRRNFKNLTANLIFMILNITLILIFTFFISIINTLREIPGTVYYSGEAHEIVLNEWNNVYPILIFIQLILIILLAISGIKTGMNYKRTQ